MGPNLFAPNQSNNQLTLKSSNLILPPRALVVARVGWVRAKKQSRIQTSLIVRVLFSVRRVIAAARPWGASPLTDRARLNAFCAKKKLRSRVLVVVVPLARPYKTEPS